MDRNYELLLQALNAALKNEQVTWETLTPEELQSLLKLAEVHRVLPLVVQAVYDCPGVRALDAQLLAPWRAKVRRLVMLQARKSAELLPLLEKLRQAGCNPLVVKGVVCRRLYPNPDYRLSSDEDLLIAPEESELCHRVLTEYGMVTKEPDSDAYEIPYSRPGGALYIELHRSLFPPESRAYGDLNRFFTRIRERAVEQEGIPTAAPTDHLLYLICHAFKHFLHSGVGIRQVCDMILYANAWGGEIDWDYILDCCRRIRAEQFAAGIFRIGRRYLGFSLEDSGYPVQWQAIYVDEQPLLLDILGAGVYGSADKERVHSSSLTLQAVEGQKKGRKPTSSPIRTLFPGAKALEGRYPYLRSKPWLLPVAWAERIARYGRESSMASGAQKSLRIGSERIELLRRYGIIDKE